MKRILMFFAFVTAVLPFPLHAQFFNADSVRGATAGGIIGGIIGHNHGRQTAEGIAIGAGSGFLLGSFAHQARQERYTPYSPTYAPYYSAAAPGTYYTPAPVPAVQPAPAPQAPPPPIIVEKSAPARPMAGANALFGR